MKGIRNNLLLLAAISTILSSSLACGKSSSGGQGGTGGEIGGTGGTGGGGDEGGDPELVGTWSGNEMSGASALVWTFTFEGGKAWVTTSGVEAYSGAYAADPLGDPKSLTILIESSPYTAHIGKTTNAIYQIEDTTLTFAGNEPGNPAVPTAFESRGNTRLFLLTKE
jgi:uncharacterized protein (TIGR03067 family)